MRNVTLYDYPYGCLTRSRSHETALSHPGLPALCPLHVSPCHSTALLRLRGPCSHKQHPQQQPYRQLRDDGVPHACCAEAPPVWLRRGSSNHLPASPSRFKAICFGGWGPVQRLHQLASLLPAADPAAQLPCCHTSFPVLKATGVQCWPGGAAGPKHSHSVSGYMVSGYMAIGVVGCKPLLANNDLFVVM